MSNHEETKKILKCFKYADKLVDKAIKERDKKGYRENLGYDQDIELRDYISKMDIHYTDQCNVLDHFRNRCDQI